VAAIAGAPIGAEVLEERAANVHRTRGADRAQRAAVISGDDGIRKSAANRESHGGERGQQSNQQEGVLGHIEAP
jgi:hypothetical protein